jgi:hypothetical protein
MPTFRYTLLHLDGRVSTKNSSYLSAYKDGIECSETSAYKIQTQGNCPEKSIQHSKPDESLKSRNVHLIRTDVFKISFVGFDLSYFLARPVFNISIFVPHNLSVFLHATQPYYPISKISALKLFTRTNLGSGL